MKKHTNKIALTLLLIIKSVFVVLAKHRPVLVGTEKSSYSKCSSGTVVILTVVVRVPGKLFVVLTVMLRVFSKRLIYNILSFRQCEQESMSTN